MGEITGISWCDHTFNPWWGCTRVSPGCQNCYAEAFDKRTGGGHWGPLKARRTFGAKHWAEPLKWHAKALTDGVRRKVFCASMADVLDDEGVDSEREKLWSLIRQTPELDWLLLTKRPENWHKHCPDWLLNLPNVWKGCTAENQKYLHERWPYMHDLPGIRFVSYEPALGPLYISYAIVPNWIICGGESGHNRRPMEQAWAESLRDQCKSFGVAFFMKQMSAATPAKGKELIPGSLRIHQFPVGPFQW